MVQLLEILNKRKIFNLNHLHEFLLQTPDNLLPLLSITNLSHQNSAQVFKVQVTLDSSIKLLDNQVSTVVQNLKVSVVYHSA